MYDTRDTDRIPQRTVRLPSPGEEFASADIDYEDEAVIETIPPEVEAPNLSDFVAHSDIPDYYSDIRDKKQQNSDVIGWLQVPGTNIDNVVLQNPTQNNPHSKKNEYYLNRDFQKQPDKNGVFCADHRATFGGGRESLSRVTTVYGHSWDDNPDGDIFAQLKRYRDPGFAREHPYIYFSTESENMAWEVFAVFDTTIYLPYVRPNLSADAFYQTLDMVYGLSYYNYDVAVDAKDRILALSTCTFSVDGHISLPEVNEYRFVVMAKLVDATDTQRDYAVFAENSSRLPPDATRSMSHL